MNRFPLNKLAACLLVLAYVSEIHAADIGRPKLANGKPMGGIMIEGEIVRGDFAKFEKVVRQRDNIDPVWLASAGGDMAEAMKIGELVRDLKLSVWAPAKNNILFPVIASKQNALCASACFFIYAAGVERRGEVLGIHRPYFSMAAYMGMSLDEAARNQSRAMQVASVYLKEMGVPSAIIERMMNIGSGKIVWLTDDEIAEMSGYIPEYSEWFKANCPPMFAPDTTLDRDKQFNCKSRLLESEQKKAKFQWLIRSAQKKPQ